MLEFTIKINSFYNNPVQFIFCFNHPQSLQQKLMLQDIINKCIIQKSEHIKFPGFELSKFPINIMKHLDFVKSINLSHNNISELPFTINGKLNNLRCEYNKFTKTFLVLNNIKYIDICNNKCECIDFYNNQTIIGFNCEYNHISSINNLNYCSSIKLLNCSHNKLINFDGSKTNIIHLNCSNNKFIVLPKIPLSIITLNITGNKISGTLDLSCYDKLDHLLCSANKINNLILGRPIMDILCCSSNKLKYFIINAIYINTVICTSNNITEAIIHFGFHNLNLTYNPLNKITFLFDKYKLHQKKSNNDKLNFILSSQIEIDPKHLRIVSPYCIAEYLNNIYSPTNTIVIHSAAYAIQKLWYSYKLKIINKITKKKINTNIIVYL